MELRHNRTVIKEKLSLFAKIFPEQIFFFYSKFLRGNQNKSHRKMKCMMKTCSSCIANRYLDIIKSIRKDVTLLGETIPIPLFSENIIEGLIQETKEAHSNKTEVINIDKEIIVVGDLYGNIFNLLQIFINHGPPPSKSYLFIGNFVDYGEYSLEVATLLMSLSNLYPDHVFVLKGVNEIYGIPMYAGLLNDIDMTYPGSTLFPKFIDMFDCFPLGAFVMDRVLCCQPFIIDKYDSMFDLVKWQRPTLKEDIAKFAEFVKDMEDVPGTKIQSFINNSYPMDFLVTGMTRCEKCVAVFDNCVSISCGNAEDEGCVLILDKDHQILPTVFDTFDCRPRRSSVFKQLTPIPLAPNKSMPGARKTCMKIAVSSKTPARKYPIPTRNNNSFICVPKVAV